LPYSCKQRSLCPSCDARRRAEWADHVVENVLPDLPYRMNVYAIPKHLRGGFLREHALLGDLSGEAYRVTARFLAAHFPGVDGVPYFVSAVHTFGSSGANPHPHIHALCSLGIKDRHGTFHRAPADLDFAPLEELFRHAVLAMLVRKRRLTEETARKFASWEHSGFSVDSSVAAAEGDRDTLHRLSCYLLKPPISLERMAYERGDAKVVYRGKPHPARGRDIEVYDPLEFLVRVLLHIPTCASYYTSCGTLAPDTDSEPDISRPLLRSSGLGGS
ncbi:MAG: transposase, partial [Candidatus Eisenbacteria bacterium]|nr:transposase [Candidatus Eisenbacteria bacterium]